MFDHQEFEREFTTAKKRVKVWGIAVAVFWLAMLGAAGYVAVHFLRKVW